MHNIHMAQENLQQQYEDIHSRAIDAVLHWDAMPAWGIYRELEKFLEALPVDQKNNPSLVKEIALLKRDLLAVGFPALPRDEAVKLFREHILDFFQVDVDLQERLLTRYTFVGYGEKEDERVQLKEAILQNEERLGPFAAGQWIHLFDERFRPEKRKVDAVQSFLTQTGEVAALEKSEQTVLRQILSVYEECLAKPVLDDFDMAVLSGGSIKQTGSGQYFNQSSDNIYARKKGEMESINLPLLQALSKYEQLGQQVITSEKIKLKTQIEPVRPSLVNWLKYYRDELGIGQHSSVERGEFLFRSENGRKLSGEERERISLVLKSVEEYLPITIDTERQEIIFPAFADVSLGRPSFQGTPANSSRQPNASFNNTPAGGAAFPSVAPSTQGRNAYFENSKPMSSKSFVAPARNVSAAAGAGGSGSVSFSAKHIFPSEKESSQQPPRSASSFQPNSFRIRPMSPISQIDEKHTD
jgi:hypothetical protein